MPVNEELSVLSNHHSKNDEKTSQLLLAEHARLSALYQHNSEMGDRLVGMYLGIFSITQAVIMWIFEYTTVQSTIISIELFLIIVLGAIGAITFARLLERRERSVEYLRAINRIHHYFNEKDDSLQNYLYWRACDDCPSVQIQGTAIGGLRDIVAVVNTIVLGVGAAILTYAIDKDISVVLLILIVLSAMTMSWFIHQRIKQQRLKSFEIRLDQKVRYRTPPAL